MKLEQRIQQILLINNGILNSEANGVVTDAGPDFFKAQSYWC